MMSLYQARDLQDITTGQEVLDSRIAKVELTV